MKLIQSVLLIVMTGMSVLLAESQVAEIASSVDVTQHLQLTAQELTKIGVPAEIGTALQQLGITQPVDVYVATQGADISETLHVDPGMTVMATINFHEEFGPLLQALNLQNVQGLDAVPMAWYIPLNATSVKDIHMKPGTGQITVPQFCLSQLMGQFGNSQQVQQIGLDKICLENAVITPLVTGGKGVQVAAQEVELFNEKMAMQVSVQQAANAQKAIAVVASSENASQLKFANIDPSLQAVDAQMGKLFTLLSFQMVVSNTLQSTDITQEGFADTPQGLSLVLKVQVLNNEIGKILAGLGFATQTEQGQYEVTQRIVFTTSTGQSTENATPSPAKSKVSYTIEVLRADTSGKKLCATELVTILGDVIPQLATNSPLQQLATYLNNLCVENMQLTQDPFEENGSYLLTGQADIGNPTLFTVPIMFNIQPKKSQSTSEPAAGNGA